jgi:hypothetical protein
MKTKILKLFTACLLLIPICISLIWGGCQAEESNTKYVKGLVMYYGSPSVDGCGWMIEIDTIVYSPINLESTFQKDSLEIILDYDTLTSRWNCGWIKPGYQEIELKEIKINK